MVWDTRTNIGEADSLAACLCAGAYAEKKNQSNISIAVIDFISNQVISHRLLDHEIKRAEGQQKIGSGAAGL